MAMMTPRTAPTIIAGAKRRTRRLVAVDNKHCQHEDYAYCLNDDNDKGEHAKKNVVKSPVLTPATLAHGVKGNETSLCERNTVSTPLVPIRS
jgi:hypothetical protein